MAVYGLSSIGNRLRDCRVVAPHPAAFSMDIQNKVYFAQLEHLSLEQLFGLVCSELHRHEIIWQKRQRYEQVWNVFYCAKTILEDWHCDFLEMGKTDEFFVQCQAMYDNWDWELVDPLEVCINDRQHNLENGHHRSFVLSCLLLQNKVKFQPVPVLNLANLRFDTSSDKSIQISYSAREFLSFAKLSPEDRTPIGEIPKRTRQHSRKLYDQKLDSAARIFETLFTAPPGEIPKIEGKLLGGNTLRLDELVIGSRDRDIAISLAFLFDASLHGILAGRHKVFFLKLQRGVFISVRPPYISAESNGEGPVKGVPRM